MLRLQTFLKMKSALISLSLQSKFDGLSGNLWVGPMEETLLHNQEVDPEDRASFFFFGICAR